MQNWLFYVLFAGILYTLGGLIFLLWVRLDKDENGKPFLNPKSLHYKITSPMLSPWEEQNKAVGICSYYVKFVFMLLVGWSFVFVWQAMKTVVYAPSMFLLGYYPIPTFDSMNRCVKYNILAVDVGEIPLPRLGNAKILPIYILGPIGYLYLFILFNAAVVLYWTLGIALVIGLLSLVLWLWNTDNATVGLTKEFLSSKKEKFCIILPIREKD